MLFSNTAVALAKAGHFAPPNQSISPKSIIKWQDQLVGLPAFTLKRVSAGKKADAKVKRRLAKSKPEAKQKFSK
jgi:hypothetical protein